MRSAGYGNIPTAKVSIGCEYPARDEPSTRYKCDETLSGTQEDTLSWVKINYKW